MRKPRYELILFFHAGMKPQDIIEFGYPVPTVYSWSGKYKAALQAYREKIREKRGKK